MATVIKSNVIDPICKTTLDPVKTVRVIMHKGTKYYFCSPNCFDAFRKQIEEHKKRKGLIGRFLDRLSKTNEREFGAKGPSCCN